MNQWCGCGAVAGAKVKKQKGETIKAFEDDCAKAEDTDRVRNVHNMFFKNNKIEYIV